MNIHKLDTKSAQVEQSLTKEEKESAIATLIAHHNELTISHEELALKLREAQKENHKLRNDLSIANLRHYELKDEIEQLRDRYASLQMQGAAGGVSGFLKAIVTEIDLNDGRDKIALFSGDAA